MPEIVIPDGGFSGVFLMENIARAMRAEQQTRNKKERVYSETASILSKLLDQESHQPLYRSIDDVAAEQLEELGQMSLAAHIAQVQPIGPSAPNKPSLAEIITYKYVGRRLHIEPLPGATDLKPIRLAHTGSYTPKLRQRISGRLSVMSAIDQPNSLEVDKRFGNSYSIQTHKLDLEPLIEITMLD